MTDRSVPVFYVSMVKAAPAVPAATSAGLGAAKAKKERDKAQARADGLRSRATAPGADPAVVADWNKALAEAGQAQSRYLQALEQERNAPKPPPAQPAPMPEQDSIDLSTRCNSFAYEDDEKKADLLKLTLDNRDLSLFDTDIMEKGTILHVQWGYPGNLAQARECVVQKTTGSLSLSVEAHDKGVLMNKVSHLRAFENKTRSEIVEQIAEENGYGSDLRQVQHTAVRHDVINQNTPDAQFMKKLADQEGFEFYVESDGLHWHERRLGEKPARILQYYLPPAVGDILDFNIDNDASAKPGKITARGRDPMERKDFEATASDANTPRTTLSTKPEVEASPQPVEIINPVTGNVSKAYASPAANPGSSTTSAASGNASAEVRPTTATSKAAAQSEADGIYKRTQLSAVTLKLKIVGDPQLAAKSIVEVRGLGQRLSGKYYVASIKHTISSGYSCELTCKREGTNGKSGGAGKASAAKPNQKQPDETKQGSNDQQGLTPVEVVNPVDGNVTTAYKNKGA